MIQIETIPVGMIQTNCYFVIDNKSLIIVDPGDDSEKLIELIRSEDYLPQAIVCTHGHYDHIGAVKALQDEYGIPIYLNSADNQLKELMLSDFGVTDFVVANVEVLDILNTQGFELIETPGHTQGGICFYNDEIVFTGDTIFAEGYLGRTDLFGGDAEMLRKSITKFFETLSTERTLYAGHGPKSTIYREKVHHVR